MLTKEKMIDLYKKMLLIRSFEETARKLSYNGKIAGNLHLSTGQEGVATGVCAALKLEDKITSTHRGHGHMIAKGGDLNKMMAELFGKVTGCCKGKGGSMHIADFSVGSLGANGIVAAGIPIATGAALAMKMDGSKSVTVAFLGDGASNQGVFYESMNMASLWNLPVLFVLGNNHYAITTNVNISVAGDINKRGEPFNIYTKVVDGNNVMEVYKAAVDCVERLRSGNGPGLLICNTYRVDGHLVGESVLKWHYRSDKEVEEWKKKCPINHMRDHILENGVASENELSAIEENVDKAIEDAVKFAENSALPGPETILEDVYA